jgi:hypothetical protein
MQDFYPSLAVQIAAGYEIVMAVQTIASITFSADI